MSAWIMHVKSVREQNPEMSYKLALVEASKTYKRADGKEVVRRKKRVKKIKPEVNPEVKPEVKPEVNPEVKPDEKEIKIESDVDQNGAGLIHARIAEAVYNPPADRKDIGEYKYKSGDSERAVFESDTEIIIGMRGTTSFEDIKTDAALAVGALKKTARYKRDKKFVKSMIKKNSNKKKIILAGHSLAGTIVSELSREFGLEVWSYNAGAGPKENLRAKVEKVACVVKPNGKRCKKTKLINAERTIADPVSILGKDHPNTKTIVPNKLNVHSISNWTDGKKD